MLRAYLLLFVFIGNFLLFSIAHGDEIAVPNRGFVSSDCVHQVHDGAKILRVEAGENFAVIHPNGDHHLIEGVSTSSCSPLKPSKFTTRSSKEDTTLYQGWNAYVSASNKKSFSQFQGTWNVPSAPPSADASSVIFLFPGLEAMGSKGFINIIQPVLRYGRIGTSPMSIWVIASWYVPASGTYFVSESRQVQEGDVIFGNMTQTSNECWDISISVVGSNPLVLTVCDASLRAETWGFVAHEAYISSCSDALNPILSCDFTGLDLFVSGQNAPSSPSWKQHYNVSHCGTQSTGFRLHSSPVILLIMFLLVILMTTF